MSDTSAFGFGPFVPGFDFLQNLARSTSATQAPGGALPGLSSWVAPTLSVEELDKRIQELKAVLFWLEQNGTALKATIQALEVQKMTLTTLQGMNVNMAELAKAFTAKAPAPVTVSPSAPAPSPSTTPAPASDPATDPPTQAEPASGTDTRSGTKAQAKADKQAGADCQAGATVDPMQWWGSLTQQFQNIAAAALQDAAAQARKAQAVAGAPFVRQPGGKARATAGAAMPAKAAAKPASRASSASNSARSSTGKAVTAKKPAPPKPRSPRR